MSAAALNLDADDMVGHGPLSGALAVADTPYRGLEDHPGR